MRSLVYCSVCFIFSAVLAFAAPQDYSAIFDYLGKNHPPGSTIIASVKDVGGKRLVFAKAGEKPARGQELLVLQETEGKPAALYPLKAVIKVDSIINDTIIASIIEKVSGPVKAEDPIACPAGPKIYLSSNIEQKQDDYAYTGVLEALLSENYDVIEIPDPSDLPDKKDYGLHMHLYKSKKHLTVKIHSIYTSSTLFSKIYSTSEQSGSRSSEEETITTPQPTKLSGPKGPGKQPAEPETAEQQKEQQTFASSAEAPRKEAKIRLPEAYQRIVAAELDGKPPGELVLLNNKGVFAFTNDKNSLTRLGAHNFRSSDLIGLHLHAMDLNKDGTDEVFATCGKKISYLGADDTRINSVALDWKHNKFVPLATEIPFYLRAVQQPEGEKILLGQKKEGPEPFEGPIFQVRWNQEEKTFGQGPDYQPAAHIYCLYQFVFASGAKNKVLVLEPANHVSLYKMPEERLLDTTDIHFGKYQEIPYPVRLEEKKYRGGFDDEISSEEVYALRRLMRKPEFQDQCFLIQKGRTTEGLQDKLLNFITRKTGRDRIVALQSSSGELYISWKSEAVPRDLIDFAFLTQNGRTRLLALERDSRGYALEVMSARQ
ncbi:MAG: VCBS repeat-containing protein [Desulfosalsimonadaceae bacterium]